MTDVYNLADGVKRAHALYSCSPREAVIAAYAQSRGDWNTWDYEKRYGSLVVIGLVSVGCGDFSALLDPTANNVEKLIGALRKEKASLSDSQ